MPATDERRHASETRSSDWSEADVPLQAGRTAVVTGASGGLGLETARVLAARGARVVMACRSLERARNARARIAHTYPAADLELVELDLGAMGSVHTAAESLMTKCGHIDLLINNAGVMEPPYARTID